MSYLPKKELEDSLEIISNKIIGGWFMGERAVLGEQSPTNIHRVDWSSYGLPHKPISIK